MADITKKIIDIDPGKSLVTMKQLRDETNAYREALLNLDEGSEEYVKIAKQVADNQAKINAAMSAGKKYTDDAAGSYNALQAELTKLRAEWKATGDEMERAQLAMRMNDLNDQLKEMDASVGNFQRNVGNYSSAFSGLAGALGEVSKIGKDASDGFEGLGKVLNLAGAAGTAFNNTLNQAKAVFKIGESIGKTTKGLSDYVAASKAAATAEKQRAKATATATVATQAETVATKSATIATKAFGIALKATGIGLIVTLVATLAANWDKVKKAMEPVIGKFEEFGNKVRNVLREVLGGIVGVGTSIVEIFKNTGKIVKAFFTSFVDYWKGLINLFKNLGSTMSSAFGALFRGDFKGFFTNIKEGFKGVAEDAKASFQKIGENFTNAVDLKAAFKRGQEVGRALFDGLTSKVKEETGGSGKEITIPVKVTIDTSKLAPDKNLEDKLNEAIYGFNLTDRLKERQNEIYKENYEQQLLDLEKERFAILNEMELTEEEKLALEELYAKKEAELREKINEQSTKQLKEELDKQIAAENEALKARELLKKQQMQMYGDIGEALGNLSGLFEEDTIAYKALATSQALISTFLAGTRVMAEEMGPWYVKVAAMAAVITAGLASVAKIVSVNPKGENSVSASAPAATAAAVPVIGGGSSINYTRSLTTAEEEDRMNQPQYVSVVDINRVQNQVKVVEDNSSF